MGRRCQCPFHNCPNDYGETEYPFVETSLGVLSGNSKICKHCITKYREHPH